MLMKAISLWQPWASLIACGAKPFETRHWAPPRELIGQPIAIHAAKKVDKDAASFAVDLMYGQHRPGGFELADKLSASMEGTPDELLHVFGGSAPMPVGCVVCIVRLDAVFQLW
jgi:ASCH domain